MPTRGVHIDGVPVVEAAQPFVRSPEWNSRGSFGIGHKVLDEWAGEELSRERRIAYGRLGFSGDKADEGGASERARQSGAVRA